MLTKIINFCKKISFINFLDINLFRKWYFKKEKETFLEIKAIEQLDETAKCKLQEEKLLELLNYAYKNCPYYKQLFDKDNIDTRSLSCFKKIPFLTKDIIRKNANEILSKAVNRLFFIKRRTGGSTGEPLEFYSDILGGRLTWRIMNIFTTV